MTMDQGLASRLKPKQRQIAWLVGQGLTNKEIARSLNLSAFTVRNEVAEILRLLPAKNRSQVAFLVGQSVGGSAQRSSQPSLAPSSLP